MLTSCDNSSTLILQRNCVLPKGPCLFTTSARGRNLGPSLRGLRRRPSSGLHRLMCWQEITNGREILPGSRFPRSTGMLPDPNWHTERNNKSCHMKWICGIRAHFPRLGHCSPVRKIPPGLRIRIEDSQLQLTMFIIYKQFCYMFRPEQATARQCRTPKIIWKINL